MTFAKNSFHSVYFNCGFMTTSVISPFKLKQGDNYQKPANEHDYH